MQSRGQLCRRRSRTRTSQERGLLFPLSALDSVERHHRDGDFLQARQLAAHWEF